VSKDNHAYQARGFWYDDDRHQHIILKELRAVRLAIESFLPQLRGRTVLLHEENTAAVWTLPKLATRSPVMMFELRRVKHLLDVNDIIIRPIYIRSAANIWAESLSRELDLDDWQLNPRIFSYLQESGGHTLSIASHQWKTHSSLASTPSGVTPSAKTSIVNTCMTPHGNARPTVATPHGTHYPPSAQSYTIRA
jgi:hypothetical protein